MIFLILWPKLNSSVFLLEIIIIPCHITLYICITFKISHCEWILFWLSFEFQSAQVIPINAFKLCWYCDSPIKHLANHIKLKFPILLFKGTYHFTVEKNPVKVMSYSTKQGRICLSLSNYSDNNSFPEHFITHEIRCLPQRKYLINGRYYFYLKGKLCF